MVFVFGVEHHVPEFWPIPDEALREASEQAKHYDKGNERTMTTSTAISRIMINSILDADVCDGVKLR